MCSARLESLDGWTRERERERENSENVLNQLIEKTLKIGYLGVRFTFVSDQKFQVNLSTKVMYDATLRSAVSDADLFIQYPILDHPMIEATRILDVIMLEYPLKVRPMPGIWVQSVPVTAIPWGGMNTEQRNTLQRSIREDT
jgi:hypothetical protein